jgi:hypothetical protein
MNTGIMQNLEQMMRRVAYEVLQESFGIQEAKQVKGKKAQVPTASGALKVAKQTEGAGSAEVVRGKVTNPKTDMRLKANRKKKK